MNRLPSGFDIYKTGQGPNSKYLLALPMSRGGDHRMVVPLMRGKLPFPGDSNLLDLNNRQYHPIILSEANNSIWA